MSLTLKLTDDEAATLTNALCAGEADKEGAEKARALWGRLLEKAINDGRRRADELELKDWNRAVDSAREMELDARRILRYLYSLRMNSREARAALEGDFVAAFANVFEVAQPTVQKALDMMSELLRCPRCGKLVDFDELEIDRWKPAQRGAEDGSEVSL